MPERPPRPPRAEPREVVELKQIKADQPELASAVDMQLALVEMQRRVQSRVPLPWISADDALAARAAGGRPRAGPVRRHPARLDRLPPDASADRRHPAPVRRARARRARRHPRARARGQRARAARVAAGTRATSGAGGDKPRRRRTAGLEQVLVLALRPFLARCAEVLMQRVGSVGVAARPLPVLRLGTGLRGHHAERRSAADLRPLLGPVGVCGRSRARSARTTTARASRRSPRATAATASTPATSASAISRRTTRGTPRGRSWSRSTRSRRCRSTRRRCSAGTRSAQA